jgi:hypothetical protein
MAEPTSSPPAPAPSAAPATVYRARVRGLWTTTHELEGPAGPLGTLKVRRNRYGMVVQGLWTPVKGETLLLRRDPGLLRSQFSLWTEGREWLGSSLRWSFAAREIVLHTGSRPLRLLPLPGLRVGWTLQAPRTGELARISAGLLGRGSRIEVFRKVEFELVVFSYFLGWQVRAESLLPGPRRDDDPTAAPVAKGP